MDTNKSSMQNTSLYIGLTLYKSPVESPSYYNGFSFDLDNHKNKKESSSIFSVQV